MYTNKNKEFKITDKIKKEVLYYLELEYDDILDFHDEFYAFYYRCMENDMHYLNADEYAILNTLFNYDIGIDNYWAITEWMDENGKNIFDLTCKDKSLILSAATELGLNLCFNNWNENECKDLNYKYFEK